MRNVKKMMMCQTFTFLTHHHFSRILHFPAKADIFLQDYLLYFSKN